ncbi:MAG: hypothetical protein PHP45_02135 [Elusimicrobiales bacterium]|nr:hypothetical protein [Elusimicrobiales bacterium]
MRKSIFFIVSFAAPLAYGQQSAPAATPANRLPDISIIGNMYGYVSDDRSDPARNQFAVREVELALQGYVYPQIKADAIIAAEKEGGGYHTGVDEAKLTFERLADGLSAQAGRVRVNFGKINSLHPHSLPTVDRPAALTAFFGEEGLVGQGAALNYTLPLPFFLQAEAGAWKNDAPEPVMQDATVNDINGTPVTVKTNTPDESSVFGFSDGIFTGRLRSSFAPSAKSELEFGASMARGRGPFHSLHTDNATVWGGDLAFRLWPGAHSRLTFQSEYFYLARELANEKLHRRGFYSYLSWRFDKEWEIGSRFDYAESPYEQNTIERAVSGIATYNFNEMFSARVQYKHRNIEGNPVNECWFQLIFGIGPHTHSMS